jgi:hypothetical protein
LCDRCEGVGVQSDYLLTDAASHPRAQRVNSPTLHAAAPQHAAAPALPDRDDRIVAEGIIRYAPAGASKRSCRRRWQDAPDWGNTERRAARHGDVDEAQASAES